MNIKVIPKMGETWEPFTMYGVEFIPRHQIIHNDIIYRVEGGETWDDDNSEVVLTVSRISIFAEADRLISIGHKLEAVKYLKDTCGWSLKECKDWVDARALVLNT